MEKALISVVVPAYNAQNTIKRCMDSILNQTYRDFELIVVNDGSTDATEDILRRYMAMDTRLVVITQKNTGVSAARNAGIHQASGKWITFVDADDYLEPDCLEVVFSNDIEQYDFIFWNYYRVKPSGKEAPVVFRQLEGEYKKEDILPYVFDNKGQQTVSSVCCRLFLKEIIRSNQIYFAEGIGMYEDKLFMIDYLMSTKQILGLNQHLYNRTLNTDSAMHCWHKNAKEEYLQAIKLLKEKLLYNEIWDICSENFYIWVFQEAITQYLETYICHSRNTANRKIRKNELYRYTREELIAEALDKIECWKLPVRSRVKFFAVKYNWLAILDKWYRNKHYFG